MPTQTRNILITGGTGILGSAVTKAYIAQGDNVAVTYLFENEVERFKQFNPDISDKVPFLFANVTEESEVQKCIQDFHASVGQLDILVNIAGGFIGGIPATELEADTMGFHDESQPQIRFPLLQGGTSGDDGARFRQNCQRLRTCRFKRRGGHECLLRL